MPRKSPNSPFAAAVTIQVSTEELRELVKARASEWRAQLTPEERIALDEEEDGYSHQGERYLCWLLALSDGDYDRIQRDGKPLVDQARAADPIRSRRAPAILPREESIVSAVPSAHEELPEPPRHKVKGHPGKRHVGEDGGQGQDAALVTHHRPRR